MLEQLSDLLLHNSGARIGLAMVLIAVVAPFFRRSYEKNERLRKERKKGERWRVQLSGWKRIGIVASVVWAVGSFVWSVSHNSEFIDQLYDARAHCMSHPDHTMTRDQCDTEYMEIINRVVQHRWEEAAIFALVPIPFGWLLVGGLFGVARWVRAGFASVRGPET